MRFSIDKYTIEELEEAMKDDQFIDVAAVDNRTMEYLELIEDTLQFQLAVNAVRARRAALTLTGVLTNWYRRLSPETKEALKRLSENTEDKNDKV